MRKIIWIILLVTSLIITNYGWITNGYAEESITITTYYPSPYDSYNQLYVADKLGIGTTSTFTDPRSRTAKLNVKENQKEKSGMLPKVPPF